MSGRWIAALRSRRGVAALAWIAVLASAAAAAAVESVGVAPITKDVTDPREAAVRAAVADAVTNAAMEMLPDDFTPPDGEIGPDGEPISPSAWVEQHLGDDPYVYATRFRIREDRGRRHAMFSGQSDVDYEYVVVADIDLDLDAVRARLAALGLVSPGSGGSAQEVRLVVEGLTSYRPLAQLRKALAADRGVRSVVPIEFTDGRAVLAIDADRGAGQLAAGLADRPPDGLRVMTVEEDPGQATVLVEEIPEAPAAEAAGTTSAPETDDD